MTLEQSEKMFIQKVLARHSGDVRKAAEQLGMSRSALYRRLQYFGLVEPRQRGQESRNTSS